MTPGRLNELRNLYGGEVPIHEWRVRAAKALESLQELIPHIDQQDAEISRLRHGIAHRDIAQTEEYCVRRDLEAEISRLTKLNTDLSAGDVKEVCELREELERKDDEITRLRTAIVEARRQVEVIAIELSNDYAKYAEQLADKLAATLADALRETT